MDHRQDHRAPILQEEENDDGDEDDGLVEGFENFVDRLIDERRRVVDDAVVDAGGEALLELSHFDLDGIGHLERIGTGQLKHS